MRLFGQPKFIRNLETGIERDTLSDEVGVYRFPAVEPGTYSIQFRAPDFESQKIENVAVALLRKSSSTKPWRSAK